MSRESLGKGLDALFATGPESTDRTTGITTLKIDSIVPNRYQPRKIFDKAKLKELADSLKQNGILQPIIVTKNKESKYELIAGERRLEAAKLANFTEIPVIIRSITPKEQLQYAIIENIQREDLNAVEEAQAYQRLSEEFGLTHIQISEIVGKERTTISNCIRILKLSEKIQGMIMSGDISAGHARAVLQVPEEKQLEFAEKIVKNNYTVRTAELEAKRISNNDNPKVKKQVKRSSELVSFEKQLKNRYNVKVSISGNSSRGKISFIYKNKSELEKILQKLKSNEE